jgi:hypothetical protein
MILVDTNILCRMTNSADAKCGAVRKAVNKMRQQGEPVLMSYQNIFEFWAVATRAVGEPTNGLGMSAQRAAQWIQFFGRRFLVVPDPPNLAGIWLGMVQQYNVLGFRPHDARLAAFTVAMGAKGLMS